MIVIRVSNDASSSKSKSFIFRWVALQKNSQDNRDLSNLMVWTFFKFPARPLVPITSPNHLNLPNWIVFPWKKSQPSRKCEGIDHSEDHLHPRTLSRPPVGDEINSVWGYGDVRNKQGGLHILMDRFIG